MGGGAEGGVKGCLSGLLLSGFPLVILGLGIVSLMSKIVSLDLSHLDTIVGVCRIVFL